MKKILIISSLFLLALSATAQDKSEKVSAGNLPKELTINGIPYSQYAAQVKTQQTANSNQPVSNPAANNTLKLVQGSGLTVAEKPSTVSPVTDKATEMQAQIKAGQVNIDKKVADMQAKQVSNKVVPAVKPTEQPKPVYEMPKVVPGTIMAMAKENKPAVINTDPSFKQSAANNTKVAEAKGADIPNSSVSGAIKTDVPAVVNSVKPVTANATETAPVSVINMGTLTPVGATVENVTTPVSSFVQPKIDNSKPVQVQEVPKSVVNPAQKVPDVPMQSEKGKSKEQSGK